MAQIPRTSRRYAVLTTFVFFLFLVGKGCGPRAELIDLGPTSIVRGIVLSTAGNPVPAARISLEGPRSVSTVSLGNGTYQIDNVFPDLYDLVAEGRVGADIQRVRVRFLRLVDDQVFIVPDLVLKPASVVTGSVVLPGTIDRSGIQVLIIGTRFVTTTDASGNFRFEGVEEGTYALHFNRSDLISATVTDLAVPSGVTVNVAPVSIRPANPSGFATLAGRVQLETRTDSSGVLVRIEGTDRSTITTSGGFFRFENLPLSTYLLSLTRNEFHDRRIFNVTLVPGTTLLTLDTVQLDSHRTLDPALRVFEIEWSPNGQQIAYVTSSDPATAEIAITDPTTQIFNTVITRGARAVGGAGLSWSPDGEDIVFTRGFTGNGNTSALGITSKEGRRTRNLLPLANRYAMPAWAPDGRLLAYYVDPAIRTIGIDRSTGSVVATTSTSRVIDSIGTLARMTGMEWANTGRIFYSHTPMSAPEGLFSVFSTGGGRLEITPNVPPAINTPQSITLRPRDFGKIAFSLSDSAGDPPNGIYVCDLDGTNATRITTVPGQHLEWSPDGTKILFARLSTDTVIPDRITQVLVPERLR